MEEIKELVPPNAIIHTRLNEFVIHMKGPGQCQYEDGNSLPFKGVGLTYEEAIIDLKTQIPSTCECGGTWVPDNQIDQTRFWKDNQQVIHIIG